MERLKVVTMNNQPAKRNMLTLEEAWSEVFEKTISKTKMYQMAQRGEVPCVKAGAKYLFRRDTLEKWMAEQERQSMMG